MSMDKQAPICGIDLGTTNSCIALIQGGKSQVLAVEGQLTMPSVVAYRDGQWLIGKAARNHLWVAPDTAVASIKRKMDDPHYQVTLGTETLSPIDISAKILKALVQEAEQHIGEQLQKVVITVPAWFKETQRQATLEAGRQAGLDVIQIINEPTAAAIAHQNIPIDEGDEEKWLVYDLGGGTFDVSVLNVTNASYEVLASQGNTYLGGDDLDHRLVEKFVTHLRDQHNVDTASDKTTQTRLQVLAEQAKIHLSSETTVDLKEPIVMGSETYLLELTLTRDDFEQLIEDLVMSTIEKATQALAEAGVSASSLSRLLLVGGSTRIPIVTERLVQHLGIEPESWIDPDLSVAMGASIRGAIAQGELFERSVVDICPHTLGIAAMGEEDYEFGASLSNNLHPMTFVPLVRRNSRLPARFVKTFYKASEHQQKAVIPVYQGESNNTRQNMFIGEFTVDFHNKHERNLDVSFAYDTNGTINLSVKELGNTRARVYSMDLSCSKDENSQFSELSEHTVVAEQDAPIEDSSAVTNYLIEKVNQRLQEQDAPHMRDLVDRYRLLLEQGNEEVLDEIEDQLYEWIESE